jgi:proteic killer suppression protein
LKVEFADKATEDIYLDKKSKIALKALPVGLHGKARVKLQQIFLAESLVDLKEPPGNRLEKMKGTLSESYSIRINDQFRIVFRFLGHSFTHVQIVDYH